MSSIIIFGCSFEATTPYARRGSRYGPASIRKSLKTLEDYSPYLKAGLGEAGLRDIGDLKNPAGDIKSTFKKIKQTVREIIQNDNIPFALGGEHLISLPIVEELLRKYPALKVLQIDAHADLRDKYLGKRLSHATVMRRIREMLEKKSLFQWGVRSGEKEELLLMQKLGNTWGKELKDLKEVFKNIKDCPLYLSFDLDVFDPGIFPGTSYPEPGGIFFPEFISLVKNLQGKNIVGMDLVELCPRCDPTGISSVLAASVLRELLISSCFWASL